LSRNSNSTTSQPLLERIPEPDIVRHELGNKLRDVRLLKQLLKLSERTARERQQRRAVQYAAT
jgi:hypothetical protein